MADNNKKEQKLADVTMGEIQTQENVYMKEAYKYTCLMKSISFLLWAKICVLKELNTATFPEFIIATVKEAEVNAFAFMEVTFHCLPFKVFALVESDSNTLWINSLLPHGQENICARKNPNQPKSYCD